jgi:hypothetical protein
MKSSEGLIRHLKSCGNKQSIPGFPCVMRKSGGRAWLGYFVSKGSADGLEGFNPFVNCIKYT